MASPLKNAKGLGSAKHGLNHWITQRVTAVALVPLTIWFVSILAMMKDSSYQSSLNLVSNPFCECPGFFVWYFSDFKKYGYISSHPHPFAPNCLHRS